MPIERETTIVTPERSSGSGILIGILLVVLILLVVGGIAIFNGGFSFGGNSVTVDVPKVTVTK